MDSDSRAPMTNCRHFDGYKPCGFHKVNKYHCSEACPEFSPFDKRILIIKTGAAGEVLRNTPILIPLRAKYPNAEIVWITQFPDLVPKDLVDTVLPWTWETAESLQSQEFDIVFSLDKAVSECALANKIPAKEVKGFVLDRNGRIVPADSDAYNKWITGVSDHAMKANKKHYIEETFDVCGLDFNGEDYQIDQPLPWSGKKPVGGPVVGINTGAGMRWTTRIWPEDHYLKLISLLQYYGLGVVLLGGPDEHERNRRLSFQSGADYYGVQPLKQFISLVDTCDVVFSSVTMAMHIAIALKKKVVAMNNVFPTNEFHFYGHGVLLEPDLECKGCYKSHYDDACSVSRCIELITPEIVFAQIKAYVAPEAAAPSAPAHEVRL